MANIFKKNKIETAPPKVAEVLHPPQPEIVPTPEVPMVESEGAKQSRPEVQTEATVTTEAVPTPQVSAQIQAAAEANYKRVEDILSEDLSDIYFGLPPLVKDEFKKAGEETTRKILVLLSKPKVQVKKIIDLLRQWLQIIPGVNKFFLEQTAKIKADKIIEEFNKK